MDCYEANRIFRLRSAARISERKGLTWEGYQMNFFAPFSNGMKKLECSYRRTHKAISFQAIWFLFDSNKITIHPKTDLFIRIVLFRLWKMLHKSETKKQMRQNLKLAAQSLVEEFSTVSDHTVRRIQWFVYSLYSPFTFQRCTHFILHTSRTAPHTLLLTCRREFCRRAFTRHPKKQLFIMRFF